MLTLRSWIFYAIFSVALLSFFILGLYKLQFFGLEYDECLFINAALGDVDEGRTFMAYKIGDLPVLTYLYIGALKSWFYAGVFSVFGVSVLSVRLPVLILATVNLLLVYRITNRVFDSKFALLVFTILAFDLTFLTLQRFDKGPSALETFFKLSILLVAVNQRITITKKGLIIFALMALGVFNKFNFIWFTNAVFGVYFLQNADILYKFLRKKISFNSLLKSSFFFYSLGYVVFLALFFLAMNWLSISPSSKSDFSFLSGRFVFMLKEIKATLLQRNVLHVFGWSYMNWFWPRVFDVAIILTLGANVWLYFKRKITFHDVHTKLILLIGLLLMQYLITEDAKRVWHIFIIFPLLPILILNTFRILSKSINSVLPLAAIAGLFLVGNIVSTIYFERLTETECVSEIFIPEINDVKDFLEKTPATTVISTDWGGHTQLQALLSDRHQFLEPYRHFTHPDEMEAWWSKFEKNFKSTQPVVILQPIGTDIQSRTHYGYNVTMQEDATASFLEFLDKKGVLVKPEKTVSNLCGDRLFKIYTTSIK